MPWKLRYASHLGYRSVDEPLFRESVGSLDPVAHIDHAASLGFAGVQYALAMTRPADEHRRVGAALARHGLETGCMLWAGFDKVRVPLWGDGSPHREMFFSMSCAPAPRSRSAFAPGTSPWWALPTRRGRSESSTCTSSRT